MCWWSRDGEVRWVGVGTEDHSAGPFRRAPASPALGRSRTNLAFHGNTIRAGRRSGLRALARSGRGRHGGPDPPGADRRRDAGGELRRACRREPPQVSVVRAGRASGAAFGRATHPPYRGACGTAELRADGWTRPAATAAPPAMTTGAKAPDRALSLVELSCCDVWSDPGGQGTGSWRSSRWATSLIPVS